MRCLPTALAFAAIALAQPPGFNYDEAKVPKYELPDPLRFSSGEPVKDAESWRKRRRPEILALFEQNVYGRTPSAKIKIRSELLETGEAFNGAATRKQVRVWFGPSPSAPFTDLLIYVPTGAKGRVPALLGLNFGGNHTTTADPAVLIAKSWVRDPAKSQRAAGASRWPYEKILQRGYAVVTAYYGDIDPDFDDGFQNGVHPLFYQPGQTRPAPDEWGTIGAWAWGLSRILDYLETDKSIDSHHVALHGHSRIGKAALWAGAQDQRFAIVISNDSGEGGAALARRRFGETTARINTSFPHWFAGNFKKFNDAEDKLPVDQHLLLALIAPRPLYVASAQEDAWADPKGEFLSALAADPVYRLLGYPGLLVKEQPPIETPTFGTIGYHIRRGIHDVTNYDWEQWMNFADKHWKRK